MGVTTVLFDLDNTLYSAEYALFDLVDVRINRYMRDVVGIAADRVDYLRRRYWQQYGVTLQGLIQEHDADAEDYLDYVHDIDVSSRLNANPALRTMLLQLPQRKVVFTNGSHDHARRVLQCLKIDDCFETIFDIRVSNYVPKPCRQPYEAVLNALNVVADECVMVEDSLANLDTAVKLGMRAVYVAPLPQQAGVPYPAVERVEQAGEIIKQWIK